ncbi:fatty acyl-AMP ligase [Microbacteriaceae bacterium VKM Ac-2855]|nr:fatty acyl-AMP ligase [Microbacteriaceae bacterium VKM Ac-2855]
MAGRLFIDELRGSASEQRGLTFAASPTASRRLSYSELDAQAAGRAVALNAAGFGRGEIALLAFSAGLDVARALTAAMYAGLVVAPVAVTASAPAPVIAERMLVMLRHSGARLILTDTATWTVLAESTRGALDGVTVHLVDVDDAGDPADWRRPDLGPDDQAILQYTSGSTGTPKGVMITQANLLANQSVIRSALRTSADGVAVGWLPHYHDMGLIGLLLHPMFVGMDAVLTSPLQFLKRPAFWLRLLSEHRATTTVAPDFAYAMCARLVTDEVVAELDLSSLAVAITGAEPVKARTLQQFADRFAPAGFRADAFAPAYGMAETTLLVSGFRPAGEPVRIRRTDLAALAEGRFEEAVDGAAAVESVACGAVAEGHAVSVVDPVTRRRRAPGEIGELWVSGPSVSAGYWRDEAATLADFGAEIADEGGVRRLRTGDLGIVVDGDVIVTGRIKDLIIVRGKNVYPQDVEERAAVLLPGVVGANSAAFSHGIDSDRVALVLEIEPRALSVPGAGDDLERIRLILVREFGLPSLDVVTVRRGSLPRTTSGKIQRSGTRELFETNALQRVEFVAS